MPKPANGNEAHDERDDEEPETGDAPRRQNKYESFGIVLYIIGALLFSFIPLAVDIPVTLYICLGGLVILIIGLILILRK